MAIDTLGKTNRRRKKCPAKAGASLEKLVEKQNLAVESKSIGLDETAPDTRGNAPRPNKLMVVLTAQITGDQVFKAIKNGAVMLLTRVDALDARSNHRTTSNSASLDSSNRPENDEEEMPLESLSPRETEILGYVAYGHSNKQIAVKLNISHQTVKNYMTSILDKLYANDRTHAVVTALRYGWITI